MATSRWIAWRFAHRPPLDRHGVAGSVRHGANGLSLVSTGPGRPLLDGAIRIPPAVFDRGHTLSRRARRLTPRRLRPVYTRGPRQCSPRGLASAAPIGGRPDPFALAVFGGGRFEDE